MAKSGASLSQRQIELMVSHPMDRTTCRKKSELVLGLMGCKDVSLRASAERTIRWEYVSGLIIPRRKARDLTVVEVARTLKTATYKIIAAEKGRIDERIYPVLRAYLRFLDAEADYLAWEAMNQDLVLDFKDAPPKRRRAGARVPNEGAKER